MPDFTARFTSGTALESWEDADSPKRTNAVAGHPHRRQRVEPSATVIAKTTLPPNAEGDTDANNGFTFSWWWAERPGVALGPHLSLTAGSSSIAEFTPVNVGHYTLGVRRSDGGAAVLLHLDVH
jgi:hypothetical protein